MKFISNLSLAAVFLVATTSANPVALPQTLGISNGLGSLQAGPGGVSYTPPPKPTGGSLGMSNPLLGSAQIGQDGSYTYKPPSLGSPAGLGVSVSPATAVPQPLQSSSGNAKGWNTAR